MFVTYCGSWESNSPTKASSAAAKIVVGISKNKFNGLLVWTAIITNKGNRAKLTNSTTRTSVCKFKVVITASKERKKQKKSGVLAPH